MGDVILFSRFRSRGPAHPRSQIGFAVRVIRDGKEWLVVARQHSWVHADRNDALRDASEIAAGFDASLVIDAGRRI